jgi:hypothetical protein
MPDMKNNKSIENLKLEYSTLRSEIIQRIGLRQQLLSIALTITGVVLGFGINNGTIAFILPLLILFLVIAWTQNDTRIRDAAIHIRDNIEPIVPGLQWETNVQKDREATDSIKWRRTILSHGGVFVFAQLIAILIGVFQVNFSVLEIVLISIDALSVIITIVILRGARRQ